MTTTQQFKPATFDEVRKAIAAQEKEDAQSWYEILEIVAGAITREHYEKLEMQNKKIVD